MATLILNSNEEEDIRLLLDTAKKLGLDLRVADRDWVLMEEAKQLSKSVQPSTISSEEIVEICSEVRKNRYEKAKKGSS